MRVILFLLLAFSIGPSWAAGQGGVSVGLLWVPQPSLGETQVGPLLSAAVSGDELGLPVFFEASMARTDFASLGQDYHHNHYFFQLGAEWFPTQGTTRIGLRLGLGAYGEYEIVETEPAQPGGDNWVEALTPGLGDHRLRTGSVFRGPGSLGV
jgi:hypothetical protein